MVVKATLIPGDGIGPEVIESAIKCIQASGVDIEWEVQNAGEGALKKYGEALPKEVILSIKKNKIALKGPTSTPIGEGFRSVNVALRKELDLFANIRPAKILSGIKTKFDKVDIITIRENIEDLYSGIEYKKGKFKGKEVPKDAAVSLKVISEKNSRRIAEFAFDYAIKNKREKVSVVHKANIMKFTDGLFLEIARKVASKYKKIKFEEIIVDNMAMQLVQKPELYDILLCPNLYGDILSDLCSGLVGGLGVAPSANIGKNYAVFEPVHGSAPKYAGKNKANPIATILSGALLLKHIGKIKEAEKIERAVEKTLVAGNNLTYDLSKNSAGTREMTQEIIKRIN